MNVYNNNNEIIKDQLEVYLLYAQYLDLLKIYYSKFSDGKQKKYFLVDKNWLDNYKVVSNYDFIKKEAEEYQYDEFDTFKSKIIEKLKRKNNNEIKKIKKPKLKPLKKSQLSSDILYPTNFEIIKQGVFDSNFERENSLYKIMIIKQSIFIFGDENEDSDKKSIFVCSIQFNEDNDDISDYSINIDYIFCLYTAAERKIFFDQINEGGSIINYLIFRNININNIIYLNNNQQQDIVDNNDPYRKKLGIFIPLINNIYEKKDIFSLEYLKNKYPDYFLIEDNKSKCITIDGDLYYNLNDGFPNCSITEYEYTY